MRTALIASGLVLAAAFALTSGVQVDEDATGPRIAPGPFGNTTRRSRFPSSVD